MALHCNQFMSAEDRFDARYVIEANSGCWLWTGTAMPSGSQLRGMMNVNGRQVRAYRYSYERFIGPIPEGKMICHRCNVALCVNPDHLYAGTHSDNVRDSVRAGTHPFVAHKERMQAAAKAAQRALARGETDHG